MNRSPVSYTHLDVYKRQPHDGRAPDYDDWDLNGDLLFWNEPLQCSYELSSMGIRVSPESRCV